MIFASLKQTFHQTFHIPMRILTRTIFICFVCYMTGATYLSAQQQPLYSQFTFNRFLFNPAVAGSDQTTVIQLAGYEQWAGFSGAPRFHTASFDTRIFEQSRKPRRNIRKKFKLFKPGTVGAGIQVFNERYGPLGNTGVTAAYTYHMKMESRQLSLGVAPVLSNLGLKSSDIILSDDEFDQVVEGDRTRRWILDFNFGAYLTDRQYFAGYSVHHLSKSAIQWGGTADTDYDIGRQHYFMGGYRYEVTSDIMLEPAMLIKISEIQKNQMDLSIKCTIKKDYWCGLSYKTSKTMSVFGGLQFERYYFCYAFDYNLSPIRKTSYGSHEILLAVQLGDISKRYRWLNTY